MREWDSDCCDINGERRDQNHISANVGKLMDMTGDSFLLSIKKAEVP